MSSGFECLGVGVVALVVLVAIVSRKPQRPTRSCPNCGATNTQPTNSDGFLCYRCEKPGAWATETQVDEWNEANTVRERIEAVFDRLVSGEPADQLAEAMDGATTSTRLTSEAIQNAKQEAYGNFARRFVEDDMLTEEERLIVEAAGRLVGLEWRRIADYNYDLYDLLFASWIRAAGPRRVKESPRLTLAPGELLTYDFDATLYENVTVQGFSATTGDAGVSLPIGGSGVAVETHIGRLNGTTAPASVEEQMADSGRLFVTTRRVVFLGAGKTLDVPIDRITAAEASRTVSHNNNWPRRLVLHTAVSTDNFTFSLSGAQIAAATIGWIKNPTRPEPEAEQPAPPATADYSAVTSREFARIMKDPDSAKGQLLTIYGRVRQFDTATGPETFLFYGNSERVDKTDKPEVYQFSKNLACAHGTRELLADVVKGDFIEAGVSVSGVFEYTTGAGAVLRCPLFIVGRISVYDHFED